MYSKIRDLEDAFDARLLQRQYPSPLEPRLMAAATTWSEAVWSTAEQQGPSPLGDEVVRAGFDLAKRPVFICGVHRSGTTLVRDLLDGHRQLSVLPSEGSFLTSLQAKLNLLPAHEQLRFFGEEWLRRLANPGPRPLFWLLGRTAGDSSPYVSFARRLTAWWQVAQRSFSAQHALWPLTALALAYTSELGQSTSGPPIQSWVEKTPTNEFYLPRLWKEFPAAKCIHVVRHPFDVYASRKRIEERSQGGFLAARRALQDLEQSLRIAIAQSARVNRSEYLMIRYEDLLITPKQVMEQVAEFLGIDPNPTLLCPTVKSVSVAPNSSFRSIQPAGLIIQPDAAPHTDRLKENEKDLVTAYTGKLGERLGYSLPTLTATRRLRRKCQFYLSHWYHRFRVGFGQR